VPEEKKPVTASFNAPKVDYNNGEKRETRYNNECCLHYVAKGTKKITHLLLFFWFKNHVSLFDTEYSAAINGKVYFDTLCQMK
jgi:hypothetical protein